MLVLMSIHDIMKLDLLRHKQAPGRSIGGVLEKHWERLCGSSLRHHESGSCQLHESSFRKQEHEAQSTFAPCSDWFGSSKFCLLLLEHTKMDLNS